MLKKLTKLIKAPFIHMPLNDFGSYDQYWQDRGFRVSPASKRAKDLSLMIDDRATVLDIGFGDGTVIKHLTKVKKPKKIIGIDISKEAVKNGRKQGLEVYQMDVTSKKFESFLNSNKFDYVVITEVLEHIQDPEKVMGLLKNTGVKAVIVSIPNAGFFMHRVRLLFGLFPVVMIQVHVKEHIRFWTKRDFLFWASNYGYRVEKIVVSPGSDTKSIEIIENAFPALFANQLMYKLTPLPN